MAVICKWPVRVKGVMVPAGDVVELTEKEEQDLIQLGYAKPHHHSKTKNKKDENQKTGDK